MRLTPWRNVWRWKLVQFSTAPRLPSEIFWTTGWSHLEANTNSTTLKTMGCSLELLSWKIIKYFDIYFFIFFLYFAIICSNIWSATVTPCILRLLSVQTAMPWLGHWATSAPVPHSKRTWPKTTLKRLGSNVEQRCATRKYVLWPETKKVNRSAMPLCLERRS